MRRTVIAFTVVGIICLSIIAACFLFKSKQDGRASSVSYSGQTSVVTESGSDSAPGGSGTPGTAITGKTPSTDGSKTPLTAPVTSRETEPVTAATERPTNATLTAPSTGTVSSSPVTEPFTNTSASIPVTDSLPAVTEPVITEPADPDTVRKIEEIADKYNAVGVQVAIIKEGKLYQTVNGGWAVQNESEVTDGTLFKVASLSKLNILLTAVKMKEAGMIDLTSPLSVYWNANITKTVTLHDIFTHTSTMRTSPGYKSTAAATLKQIQSSSTYFGGKIGDPGVWTYNTYAFGIAGATLEMALGYNFEDYAAEYIYSLTGIGATYYPSSSAGDGAFVAALYDRDHKITKTVQEALAVKKAEPGAGASQFGGGLYASASDIAKMIAILANDGIYNGVRILSPESVSEIEERLFTVSEGDHTFDQALTLRYKEGLYGTDGLYYHTGNSQGMLSLACYDPETRNGVVVITTGAKQTKDSQGVYSVCSEIARFIYTELKG